MNLTTQPPSFDDDEKLIRGLLEEAGDCRVTPTAEHLASVRKAISSRLEGVRPARPQLSRRTWLKYAVGGAVAASAVFAASTFLRPPDLWAQVVEAMGVQPWIHGATKGQQDQSQEFWLSVPRRVYALRSGRSVIYGDYRTGVQDSYITDQNLLVRQALTDKGPFQRLATFYTSMIHGEPKPGDVFGKDRVQKQTQRTVHDGGRTWLEFEWTLAWSPQGQPQVAVMRVDPETRLPVFEILPRVGGPVRYDFDFPKAGPADAYALGVPRDAHVENRLPSPEGQRAVQAGQAGRKDLDNYFAIVYETMLSPFNRSEIISVHLVWRKGDKWRLEYCKTADGRRFPKLPPANVDLSAWWQTELANLVCVPDLVCDGRQINSRLVQPREDHAEVARAYGQHKMIEVEAYPQIAPTGRLIAEKGSSKALFEADGPVALRTKVWLDPTRGFVAVRQENDFVDAPREVARVYEYSDFRQTPRGVWYPTTVRAKSVPKPGMRQIADVVDHYLIDFNAELPESLFTPIARE